MRRPKPDPEWLKRPRVSDHPALRTPERLAAITMIAYEIGALDIGDLLEEFRDADSPDPDRAPAPGKERGGATASREGRERGGRLASPQLRPKNTKAGSSAPGRCQRRLP
jgi:hypothetical protein